MAEQLPFSCLCKAVVEKIVWRERERACTQNGEDRIVKIQELVYNRPNLIRSEVGSVSTFGCVLQFRFFFSFLFSNLCVYSVQCRQKVKLNNANVHLSIIVVHKREKESDINMCEFSLVFVYRIHIFVHIYVCSCMCSPRGADLCHCQYVQVGSGGQLCACV